MKSTSLNLLLIESNRGDRRWVREALHWGEVKGICPAYYLHQCERVEQALERLKEGNANVILVDLDLPESGGTDALTSLSLAAPDTPILALTSKDDDEFGLEAIRKGAQDFLVKGHTDKRHLVRSVLFAVERNRMLDQIQRSEKGWNSILAKLRDMGTGRGVSRLTREFVHEFNNLMSVLKGYSLLLRRNLKDSKQEYEWACKLVDTLDRGTGLTRSLQDFSASGTSTSEPTDLNELLIRVYESLRTFTGQKHSSELNFSELPEITVANQELEGTLLALLLFAPDLRQQGKIIKWFTSTVHLSAEEIGSHPWYFPPGNYAEIRMEIPGMILNQDLMTGLQDPISSLSSQDAELLLILSSLLDTIKKDRGHLVLKGAEKGRDPRMCLYFPLDSQLEEGQSPQTEKEGSKPATSEVSETSSDQPAEQSPVHPGILLIDDEPELLYLLGHDLKELGFDVFTAISGQDSFKILEESSDLVCLVILDLKMPEMSGEEVYHRIKLDHPDLPVFILTGYGEDRIIQDLINAGVKGVLPKPYDLKHLMGVCKPYLPDIIEDDDWDEFFKA